MCGLVGVVSKYSNGLSSNQRDAFNSLLFVDCLRGMDSTGVFSVLNNSEVLGAKEAVDSLRFLRTKEHNELMSRAVGQGAAVIGHNRKATRGTVNDANAHPFVVDNNIVLVHNGTMWGDHKQHADVDVDSHAIAHLIHEKQDIEKALSSFRGAYALIWYDFAKRELNMVRNDERPLHWMETEDGWYWASEDSMLAFVADRHGLKIKGQIHPLPEDLLQTFTLKDKQWSTTHRALKITEPTYNYGGNSNVGNVGDGTRIDEEALARAMSCDVTGWTDADEEVHAEWRDRFGGRQVPPFRKVIADAMEEQNRTNRRRALEFAIRQASSANEKGGAFPTGKGYWEPNEFACTEANQRILAQRNNKVVPYGQYRDTVLATYPVDSVVEAIGFDYGYVNGRDSTDGFYLYCSSEYDPDVIIRHYYDQTEVSEEQIIQLAGCEHKFVFKLGTRSWTPFNLRDKQTDQTPGACVIKSKGVRLVASGHEALMMENLKKGTVH